MNDAERAEKMARDLMREIELTRGSVEKKREDIARLEAEQQRTRGAVDAISKRLGRPGAGLDGGGDLHLQAKALLELKHNLRAPKRERSRVVGIKRVLIQGVERNWFSAPARGSSRPATKPSLNPTP